MVSLSKVTFTAHKCSCYRVFVSWKTNSYSKQTTLVHYVLLSGNTQSPMIEKHTVQQEFAFKVTKITKTTTRTKPKQKPLHQ